VLEGVIALIPARAGSVGLPRKNVQHVAGRPLIEWTIEAALRASSVTRVVVSSDDPEVQEVCTRFPCEFLHRPAAVSTSTSSADDVIQHFLSTHVDELILTYLQPTSPCRTSEDIDRSIEMIRSTGSDAVVSIVRISEKPEWMFRRSDDGSLTPLLGPVSQTRRQDLQATYKLNGAIYTAWVELLKQSRLLDLHLLGHEMPWDRSIDIDEAEDLAKAESFLRNGA